VRKSAEEDDFEASRCGQPAAGFVPRNRERPGSSDWQEFTHPDSAFPGTLRVSFDPGFPRQLDYGYGNWLRPDLLNQFMPLEPRDIIPAITGLNYEVRWQCEVTSSAICWDVVTEANPKQTLVSSSRHSTACTLVGVSNCEISKTALLIANGPPAHSSYLHDGAQRAADH
jgi:hypothetical protein